jgi:CBS domain-containing protein
MDPRVAAVARPARAVGPDTRIGMVAEILRMSPYRAVAVVEGERLVGMASEGDVLDALLGATDAAARARVREMPVGVVMTPHPEGTRVWVTPGMRASEAAALFDQAGTDALPVVDAYMTYLGLVARSDLVQDLVRPFRPPTVGGMATPLGVYLTTGAVSGGAGTLALLLLGFVMFLVHLLAQGVAQAGQFWLTTAFTAQINALPEAFRLVMSNLFPFVAQFALLLVLLRLSPIAGYHAAEHQVVHALERAEPLLVETVRAMPRVHPRCGTNLVAGMLILLFAGGALYPLLDEWSFGLSFIAALAYWRTLGAWLQQHFTTRPATDAQIESGIRAARQLLEQHGRAPYAPTRPSARLWRMGFLQILGGFATGNALLWLILQAWPELRSALGPLGDALLF